MYKKPIEIFMMLFGMLVVLASCNEDGNTNTSKQVKNAKPWTADYFQYELTGDGTGVVITGFRQEAYEEKANSQGKMFYMPKSNVLYFPAEIENLPVKGICFTQKRMSRLANENGDGDEIPWDLVIIPDTVEFVTSTYNVNIVRICAKKIVPGKKAVYGYGNEKGLSSKKPYPNNPDYEFFFLEEFVVPDTVKQKLGAYHKFNGTTVIILDRIEELKDFSSDTLKSITFPKNLKKINGNYGEGFSYCRNLTEIIIPDEIKQIEFDWCSFKGTHLTLKTQAKLKELGYTGSF